METVTIDNRADFAQWAVERAREIVSQQGTALAMAARDMDEKAIGEAGNSLGQAIADAMIEVFDGLMAGVEGE
jgi:hypothetical protein